MTRKRRRLWIVAVCGIGLSTATALALLAFNDSVVFFMSPSDLEARTPSPGRLIRLGGLVETGSVRRGAEDGKPVARFKVTDGANAVEVSYAGILPDLFREGQGVVTLGTLLPDGTFRASEVLAKHDENYMPRDVAEALKRSGHWNPDAGPPPPASTWNTLAPKPAGG